MHGAGRTQSARRRYHGKRMPSRIEDYALIGDCHTAALVARDGSIDWLCLPRFDSGACFAALLGNRENGRWLIRPAAEIKETRRRYRGDTLILETDYVCEHGVARVTDFMPPRSAAADVFRIVEGVRGQVPMFLDLVLRFDYGSIVPWVEKSENGIRATAGPDTVHLRADVPLRGENFHTVSNFDVAEGQTHSFALTWTPTHEADPEHRSWKKSLTETEEWWLEWSGRCTYEGQWREPVMRSLLTLKALTYLPTGGMVAAPTTSLPEHIGGVRNWDYRYCWVRDATFTLYALIVGGYRDEADAWRRWLVRAIAGTPSQLQIMYGLGGERRLPEWEVPWLEGYENSSPVRVGNAAHSQLQLDVYGEILDTMRLAHRAGLDPSEHSWNMQRALLRVLEDAWRQPDHGIWEIRGPRRHFTHSKVMAWVAMDRGVSAVERIGLPGDASKWRKLRDEIHAEVCREGYDSKLNSFVQYYGSRDPDASLLMLPAVGFLPAEDERIRGTVALVQRELTRDGFVQRYHSRPEVDGLPPGEGIFLLCTFWLADNLALQKRFGEAREILERCLDLRNDVGLLPEEYDPAGQRFLGNFPQAFSHVGLINTARNLMAGGGPVEDRRRDR
ncbi:MAG: glycoside hydrolase family 15 protein [Bryobacteraceae bacterium]